MCSLILVRHGCWAAQLMCLSLNWVAVLLDAAVQSKEFSGEEQLQDQACMEGVANDTEHRAPLCSAFIRAKGLQLVLLIITPRYSSVSSPCWKVGYDLSSRPMAFS